MSCSSVLKFDYFDSLRVLDHIFYKGIGIVPWTIKLI